MSASNEETLHPIDRWARAVCETAAPQDRAGRSLEDAARLQLFGPAMNAITQQDPEGRHLEDQAFAGLFGGPAPAPPAPQRIGKYVLGGPLGSGGMGDVFLALHTELHRKVAIKLLRVHKQRDPVERSRLLREAQALAQLDHNNVVQVYDSGLHEDRVYLVMKYVEGCTLRAWQDAAHRSWREVVQHYVAAGRGLAAIHAAGLVHRDFKPQNVLVSALDKDRPTDRASVAERVKITDFGLAVTPGERTAGTTVADAQGQTPGLLAMQLTASASVLGTPLYVSPEQLGAQPLDARSDQFSFCVALYEALYGEHPYAEPDTASDSRAPTDNQTRAAVGTRPSATPSMASLVTGLVQGPLRRPKKIVIPGRIYRAIERGLSREPAGRYPTMAELLAALERDPVRKYGTLVGMAGLGALVVGAAVAPQLLSKCNDIAADFKDAWTPRRAADVERAFLATDSPHAALAAARVKQTLDAYSEQWLQLRAENCDTGRDRGTQTLEVTGRRDTCLDHARDTLAATVEQLTHADATTVETVQDALALLPALEQCDAKFQRQQTCLDEADDPQLRHRLDEARALEIAGKYVDAGEVATTVLADAGAHPRLMAESQLLRGRVLAEQDRSIEADAAFAAAYGLSEGAGCDTLAFEAATRRTKLIALNHDLPAETGLAWSEVARSKLGALPPSPRLEADLHSDLGLLLQQREDLGGSREEHLARAREEHGRALELRKQLAGDRETPELAFSYLNLGALEVSQGRHELAVEDLQ
ncbi:MAG TPA: serine/threonine-protein kinase, partial [Nannocystis sp.]